LPESAWQRAVIRLRHVRLLAEPDPSAPDTLDAHQLALTLGDITQALAYATQSVELADRSQDAFQRMVNRTTLADTLLQAGYQAQAEAVFREAEALQQERQPASPLLYSLSGFRYCELLLSQGQVEEVRRRTMQTLAWVTQAGWLLDIVLDHLTLGQALLQAHLQDGSTTLADATHLHQAVDGLRQAGAQEFISRGLLARAALYRAQGAFTQARSDLWAKPLPLPAGPAGRSPAHDRRSFLTGTQKTIAVAW
jgi:hypothetical protein